MRTPRASQTGCTRRRTRADGLGPDVVEAHELGALQECFERVCLVLVGAIHSLAERQPGAAVVASRSDNDVRLRTGALERYHPGVLRSLDPVVQARDDGRVELEQRVVRARLDGSEERQRGGRGPLDAEQIQSVVRDIGQVAVIPFGVDVDANPQTTSLVDEQRAVVASEGAERVESSVVPIPEGGRSHADTP